MTTPDPITGTGTSTGTSSSSVTVSTDKTSYQPGDTVQVHVHTTAATYDVRVIRDGADGVNAGITADPTWAPLWNTPAFPSYISGHSTFSAAAAAVLAACPDLVPAPFDAPEARAVAGESSAFRLVPAAHGTDGYFVAMLRRRPTAPSS